MLSPFVRRPLSLLTPRLALLVALLLSGVLASAARADWTTYHGDAARSGVDRSSGAAVPFASAWTSGDLGATMWSEPLVYRGLVIAATEGNDVVALNESTGQVAWRSHAGTPVPSSKLPCGDIQPTVGMTSTPVVDPAAGIVYAVADLWDGSHASHVLLAYNATTGAEVFRRTVDPTGSIPENQLQRESLALDGGRVLIGFGGNDGDCASYKGYLVSAPANNSGANTQYQVPTSNGGAIWSGGGAPAIDQAGNVYVPTGNAASSDPTKFDHGDTLEKLNAFGGELDYWAPASWAQDSASDADLGSVSPQLVAGGLAYQGGKNGNGYLVNTAALGHIGGELFSARVCNSFGSDAYANGMIYVACTSGVHALALDATNHRFSAAWSGPSDANGPPILAGGLVWVASTGSSKLYGLDPQSGAVKVTQSTPAMEHFVTPSASDGKLFIATGHTIEAYTIASAAPPAPAPPAPQPAPPPLAHACPRTLSFHVAVPRHNRVVRVSVFLGRRLIARRHGHRLARVRFASPTASSFRLRVVETLAHGRHVSLSVTFRNCHRVTPPRHHR